VLTKTLLPLPDKWHGLTDIEKRYKQRCARARAPVCSTGAQRHAVLPTPQPSLLLFTHHPSIISSISLTPSIPSTLPNPFQTPFSTGSYVDMIVTDETRATFRARSRIISVLRRQLEDAGFLEARPPGPRAGLRAERASGAAGAGRSGAAARHAHRPLP
jgi:hypothetical protein